MAEKLSITIFLDGAAEIERQLEGIGEAGTKAFADIGKAAENVGGFDQLDPKDVTKKLEQFGVKGKAAIDKITAAVASAGRLERIVGGVRQVEAGFASIGVAASAMTQKIETAVTSAGAAMTGLVSRTSGVARALRLIGIGGGVAGLGAVAVGMEKAADAARVLEGNLQALFRSQSGGTQFFNQIQNAAQTAGSSLEKTAQTMVAIVKLLQQALQEKGFRFAPGEGLKQAADAAAEVFDTLQKGMKLTGTRADDATKAIKDLFTEISKNQPKAGDTFEQASQKAKRMADVLRELGARFPQLANELVKFLGLPGQSMEQLADQVEKGIKKIDINKFIAALKRADPEIQKLFANFDQTLAQRMDNIGAAWERLLDSFGKSPAGAVVKAFLDDVAKGLDEIAKKQAQVGKFTVEKPPETLTGAFLDEVLKTIATTKKEWEALVSLINQTKFNLGKALPDKITVPFEGDPELPFIEKYLAAIERVKAAFKAMFTPDVAPAGAPEPAFVQTYLAAIERVKAAFKAMFTPDVAPAGAPEPAFVQTYLAAIERVKAAFTLIFTPSVAPLGAAEPAFVQTYLIAIEKVKAAFQTIFTPSVAPEGAPEPAFVQAYLAAIETIKNALTTISWEAITSAGVAAWNAITGAIQSTQSAIGQFASSLASITWDAISGAGVAAWNAITSAIQNAISAIQNAISALGRLLGLTGGAAGGAVGGASAGGQVGSFQGGGLLGGRGTGTSDSNLVRVSRGEYIIPARAVKQPGVLAFLEALRRSGGNLRDVLDDMGRFALGGLVPRAIPAFATGGLAGGGMSNVTIQFPGMPEISGLRAPAKVVEELRKTAALAQVRSGGRKPSRYS